MSARWAPRPTSRPSCDLNDDWFYTEVAAGLDRALPHTIKVTLDFLEGPRNDVVRVWVDGALVHVDTSWEDYFRYCEGNPTRTVDSVLFGPRAPPAPATAGNGFLPRQPPPHLGALGAGRLDPGAWTLTPDQQTTTTATAVTTQYRARVQHPIKADGTTVFAAKKGVIPVRFELDSSVRTVVTETTITGDVRFESIGSDVDTANDFAALSFVPGTPLSFADLDRLVADYAFTTGNCVGGSLHAGPSVSTWAATRILPTTETSSSTSARPVVHRLLGAASMTGQNLVGNSDARFDLTQVGGPFYGTYADALALVERPRGDAHQPGPGQRLERRPGRHPHRGGGRRCPVDPGADRNHVRDRVRHVHPVREDLRSARGHHRVGEERNQQSAAAATARARVATRARATESRAAGTPTTSTCPPLMPAPPAGRAPTTCGSSSTARPSRPGVFGLAGSLRSLRWRRPRR